jgi:hypothetical protein
VLTQNIGVIKPRPKNVACKGKSKMYIEFELLNLNSYAHWENLSTDERKIN